MESSQISPSFPTSPKSTEASAPGVLRPSNSNASTNSLGNNNNNISNSNNGNGKVSPIGPSPTILKEPLIIDIDHKSLQQPGLAHPFVKVASATSREGLKRQVERRRMTLTVPERNFLEHLCAHGNEVEVQLACDKLGDEDLFFDWQTPRHLKASENQAPEDQVFDDNANNNALPSTQDESNNTTPRPVALQNRVLSIGSQRRLEILEDRKHQKSPLWQAHESGIAVTQAASKKSIFKRTSSVVSILSNGSAASPQMIRDSSRFSFASTNTGASTNQHEPVEIFRRVEPTNKMKAASPLRKARYQRSKSLTGGMLQSPLVPPPRGFQQQQRRSSSKSVTFSSQTPPTAKRSSSVILRRSNSDMVLDASTNNKRPPTGRPPLAQRSESMASVPSIHHASPLRSESMSSIPSIHHATALRSDSIGSIPSIRHASAIRSPSNAGSIPSIRHATALRSDSISSIPSIHHANAVRSPSAANSVGTVPSIRHGTALRSESIGSIPSIHHANAVRSDSASTMMPDRLEIFQNDTHVISGTFPVVSLEALDHSLMDDTDDDTNNIDPDDPLSPGTSLHSRKKVLDNQNSILASMNSILGPSAASQQGRTKVLDHQNSLVASTSQLPVDKIRQELLPTYSATPDIASAWLNQQHFRSKPFELQRSEDLPPVVQIPSATTDKTDLSTKSSEEAAFCVNQKAVLVRRASRNSQYDGEGMEVTETDAPPFSFWDSSISGIRQCTSFDDETMSLYSHRQNNFDEVFRRSIRRTFSDEEVVAANMMVGGDAPNAMMFREISNITMSKRVDNDDLDDDGDASWDLQSRSDDQRFDSWNIVKDEYVNGYGGGGSLDFMILGTNADDLAASPHVLSPPMMESLAGFLPYAQSSENFFLRYSLVRDGASMLTFLKRSRGVQYGILALETVDGEVFGCFTGQPWRKSPNFFGTGESFLWKMRRSRLEETSDILEQAQLESEIDVYPHTGENQYYQLCTHDRIAVGAGTPSGEKKTTDPPISPHEWGFGLDIQGDLLVGTSSPCATFDSPSLSKVHADGSLFEIVNLELWAMTPCTSVLEAENLELGKLFLERQ